MKILDYRSIPDASERKAKHPYIDRVYHSDLIHALMFVVGFALVGANLLVGHSAIADPYLWSMTANVFYYTLTRPTYVIGVFLILFVFFTGGFTLGKAFLCNPLFRVCGKLTYETALITPMMAQFIYS